MIDYGNLPRQTTVSGKNLMKSETDVWKNKAQSR